MHFVETAVGVAAALLSSLSYIPQVKKVWSTDRRSFIAHADRADFRSRALGGVWSYQGGLDHHVGKPRRNEPHRICPRLRTTRAGSIA